MCCYPEGPRGRSQPKSASWVQRQSTLSLGNGQQASTGILGWIVKHVVQRHGGELDIHSEPGQGSRFRLVFPAARVRVAEPAQALGA